MNEALILCSYRMGWNTCVTSRQTDLELHPLPRFLLFLAGSYLSRNGPHLEPGLSK
jgi:hypothetical protein